MKIIKCLIISYIIFQIIYQLNKYLYNPIMITGLYNIRFTPFYAAKDLRNSDYIRFSIIPKRSSYHLNSLTKPENLIFHHLNVNNKQVNYTNDWCRQLIKKNNWVDNPVQLLMSDGSVKDDFGGFGFFSSSFHYYLNDLDLNKLRENNYIDRKEDNWNGISNYCFNIRSNDFRCNIEHCEVNAAKDGLDKIWRYCYDIGNYDINKVPVTVILAIDNQTVVNWIGGACDIDNVLILDEIQKIHNSIIDLSDFNVDVHLI